MVINLGVIQKGIISAKYEVIIFYGSNVIAKVTVDNRQIIMQTPVFCGTKVALAKSMTFL